jgi:ribosomal protein L28
MLAKQCASCTHEKTTGHNAAHVMTITKELVIPQINMAEFAHSTV